MKLGKFDELKSVPKVVARLGQCFTQSRVRLRERERENLRSKKIVVFLCQSRKKNT